MQNESVIRRFNQSLSVAHDRAEVFEALYRLTDELVGARLFTIMCVNMDTMLASRAFTSDSDHYPTSGTKPVEMNRWFDIVHGRQVSFVANTLAGIATVFPDHELIGSLGCGSVVNLPVILGSKLVATVNMLHAEHHYTKERVALVEQELALPAMAALMFDECQRWAMVASLPPTQPHS